MRVQKITNREINSIDSDGPNLERTKKINNQTENNIKKVNNDFSPGILLKAIENLENNKHLDNSHPLSKIDNAPIESLEEAIIELRYFKSPFFKANASAAQANLKNEDILYLFK